MCVCLSLSFSKKSLFYAFTRARVTNVSLRFFASKSFRKHAEEERERIEKTKKRQRRQSFDRGANREREDDDDELREKEDRKPITIDR